MLVSFHKGFIMEGEASFKERKHFWSKPELVRRKIYSTTGVYGICDDSELDAVVEKQIQKRLNGSGWGTDFSGWQRVLSYEESVEVAECNNWSKDYTNFSLPSCELTTRTLEDWTVKKAASELNGKQFAQYCRDYGITIKESKLMDKLEHDQSILGKPQVGDWPPGPQVGDWPPYGWPGTEPPSYPGISIPEKDSQVGWVCPKCGRCWAPHIIGRSNCNKSAIEITY